MQFRRDSHVMLIASMAVALAVTCVFGPTTAWAADDEALASDVQTLVASEPEVTEVLNDSQNLANGEADTSDDAAEMGDAVENAETGEATPPSYDGEPTDANNADDTPVDSDQADKASAAGTEDDATAAVDAELPQDEDVAAPSELTVTVASTSTTVNALGATAEKTPLDGVDISGWNVGVNFSKLGDFVIIKATQWNPSSGTYTYWTSGGNGSNNGSLSYTKQADAALAAGKLIGFYHFFVSPNYGGSTGKKATVAQQAQGFIDAVSVKDSSGKYKYLGQAVLVLDWEDCSYSTIESHVGWAKEWLDYVYDKTGVKPLIYMNYNCSNAYNWSSVANAGYGLWGAQYFYDYYYDAETGKGTKIKSFVSNPRMSTSWGAWGKNVTIYQYTATANLHNNNNYDVNKYFGTKLSWLTMALSAREVVSTAAEAAKFLQNGSVYSFSPTTISNSLTVSNSSSNAQLGSSNYTSSYWRVENLGSGLYKFYNLATGKALSFASSVSNSANVSTSAALTTWRLIKCTNGSFALAPSGYDAYRLDVASGKIISSGSNLQLYKGNGTAAQRFFFTKSDTLTDAYKLGKTIDDGIYTFKSNLDGGKVLDISGGSTANGANVQMYSSNDTLAQRYQITYAGNGLYTIESYKSGKVLDVAGGSTANCANVQQYAANSTLAQYWYAKKVGDIYTLFSAKSGKALDIAGASTANGANVQIYTPNGSKAQQFRLVKDEVLEEAAEGGKTIAEGIYTLASVFAPTRVLDIAGASMANGGNAQIYQSNGTLAQKFELEYLGNGLYTIRSTKSGKLLTAAANGKDAGANVYQYQSCSARSQMWYLVKLGDDLQIRSAVAGLALSLESSTDANGVNVCVKKANTDFKRQKFTLTETPLFDDDTYTIKSSLGNYRLSITNGSTSVGGNAQIFAASTHPAQLWQLTYLGAGMYKIVNVNSGLALEVAAASKASGANVQQGKYSGAKAQQWIMTITSTGAVAIKNAASGLALDVAGAKAASGTNVQQYTGNGTAAQSFALSRA